MGVAPIERHPFQQFGDFFPVDALVMTRVAAGRSIPNQFHGRVLISLHVSFADRMVEDLEEQPLASACQVILRSAPNRLDGIHNDCPPSVVPLQMG